MTRPPVEHHRFAVDDFDTDAWDTLCYARKCYINNQDKRLWYAALRTFCGYRGGSTFTMRDMGALVDAWLAAHPSWTGRFMR